MKKIIYKIVHTGKLCKKVICKCQTLKSGHTHTLLNISLYHNNSHWKSLMKALLRAHIQVKYTVSWPGHDKKQLDENSTFSKHYQRLYTTSGYMWHVWTYKTQKKKHVRKFPYICCSCSGKANKRDELWMWLLNQSVPSLSRCYSSGELESRE